MLRDWNGSQLDRTAERCSARLGLYGTHFYAKSGGFPKRHSESKWNRTMRVPASEPKAAHTSWKPCIGLL